MARQERRPSAAFWQAVWFAETIGATWALVEDIASGGPTMIGSVQLPPSAVHGFYAFLVALGPAMILAFNWMWISKLPAVRRKLGMDSEDFRLLYGDLTALRAAFASSPRDHKYVQLVGEVSLQLDRLSVPFLMPSTQDEAHATTSLSFLSALAATAKVGDIKRARQLAGRFRLEDE